MCAFMCKIGPKPTARLRGFGLIFGRIVILQEPPALCIIVADAYQATGGQVEGAILIEWGPRDTAQDAN